jgi:hypothetical protein
MSLGSNCTFAISGSEFSAPRRKVLVACSIPLNPLHADFAAHRSAGMTGAEPARTEAREIFHCIRHRSPTALLDAHNGS